ncbi:MAG: ATP-binding cassette domain-containing protein [Bacteroidetes bacterium]|nr:MAG: ATP-binding cassette domain-containing protein [Bacteroidota bacterium]
MKYIIEAKNIVKKFEDKTALKGIDIRIPEKSIFGLLGPNGAGKTTFIRIINQISYPDEGEILFDGGPLLPETVEQIGYLPEERGLYRKMEVGEQALYLAGLKGLPKQEALQCLKHWFTKFEIENWWNKKVEELSKGMQQKIQFITTVVHQPKLLILDEPFSGFDPVNTQLIKKEILELRAQGATVIFSTHNMKSVEEICDEIALINHGEVILNGTVEEVRKKYSTRRYEIVFKNSNWIAFANALWAGFELVEKEEKNGVFRALVSIPENSSVNQLLQAVIPIAEIISVQEKIPSMDEIFINVVTQKQTSDVENQ